MGLKWKLILGSKNYVYNRISKFKRKRYIDFDIYIFEDNIVDEVEV